MSPTIKKNRCKEPGIINLKPNITYLHFLLNKGYITFMSLHIFLRNSCHHVFTKKNPHQPGEKDRVFIQSLQKIKIIKIKKIKIK